MITYFSPASPDWASSRRQAASTNSGIVASSRLTYSVIRSRAEIRYHHPADRRQQDRIVFPAKTDSPHPHADPAVQQIQRQQDGDQSRQQEENLEPPADRVHRQTGRRAAEPFCGTATINATIAAARPSGRQRRKDHPAALVEPTDRPRAPRPHRAITIISGRHHHFSSKPLYQATPSWQSSR